MPLLISPTKREVRGFDAWGCGAYGASRGNGKKHNGTDFICTPGQEIIAPISGYIARIAWPYTTGNFAGLVIEDRHLSVSLFYLWPDASLIETRIHQGAVIGTAQDISAKYPGITPHIHLRIDSLDPEILMLLKVGEK